MSKLINDELVKLNISVANWQEALVESCRALIDNKFVTERYVELIIDVVNESGPYFILLENFALPHVSASKEVLRTGLSITTLKEPVKFENGKQVKVLFTLATKDNEEHLGILTKLSKLLQKDSFVEDIYQATSLDQIKILMEER